MKLLVLHRIPYHKVNYHRGIDHDVHEVTYIGTAAALATLPEELRCRRVERPGAKPTHEEVFEAFSAREGFERVISLSEYELMDAARVREAWGVAGPRPHEVELVRDKVRMKEAVAQAGLRIPRFASAQDALEHGLPWSGKTVLKPRDGASSEGVSVHASSEMALSALKSAEVLGERRDLSRWELEEYLEGPILHIDGLMSEGLAEMILASQYLGTCLDYAHGKPLGSVQLENSPELNAWAERCLRAVRLNQGAFHLEAILTAEGPAFLEVANRVGGADVVDTFELATGVYLPAEELRLIVGERPRVSCEKVAAGGRGIYGWFVFPGHHFGAEFCSTSGTEHFRGHLGVVRWNELSPEKRLPKNITYQSVEVPVAGVLRGRSTEEVQGLMQKIFDEVKVASAESARGVA